MLKKYILCAAVASSAGCFCKLLGLKVWKYCWQMFTKGQMLVTLSATVQEHSWGQALAHSHLVSACHHRGNAQVVGLYELHEVTFDMSLNVHVATSRNACYYHTGKCPQSHCCLQKNAPMFTVALHKGLPSCLEPAFSLGPLCPPIAAPDCCY